MKEMNLATDSICGMRESEESKMKPKLWMVKEGASERFDKIPIEGRESKSREDLLSCRRSKFERLSLRNIESPQKIIFLIRVEI